MCCMDWRRGDVAPIAVYKTERPVLLKLSGDHRTKIACGMVAFGNYWNRRVSLHMSNTTTTETVWNGHGEEKRQRLFASDFDGAPFRKKRRKNNKAFVRFSRFGLPRARSPLPNRGRRVRTAVVTRNRIPLDGSMDLIRKKMIKIASA